MRVNIRIRRYNPEKQEQAWWSEHTLENCAANDTVLELLHRVKWEIDGTLALRRSCAHGVCGSDAFRINGANMLACKTLIARLMKPDAQVLDLQVEPILGLRVLKDLIVDMKPFFDHYKSVKPWFMNDSAVPADGRERLQSAADRAKFDDTTKCILCAACTTSCPSFWSNENYIGPAAIVQAHRFIFDNRDHGAAERLEIVGETFGVWRCRTNFNCTNACPRDIEITKAIAEVKKALYTGRV